MLQIVQSDKRSIILHAALEVFITYGFRKTSMDDIARAAHMSRPALYQTFKNKTEIFRALAAEMVDDAAKNARQGFERKGSFRQRLWYAIEMSILEMHRFIDQTAHGNELVGISDEIAGDISERWVETLIDVIAGGIRTAAEEGEISLERFSGDAAAIARVFVLAIEGLKPDAGCGKPIEPHVRIIVDFFADALEVSERQAS